MKRGWVAALVLVLVAQMAVGWLDPWRSPLGRWPPPAGTVGLLLVVLGVGWIRSRRARRPGVARRGGTTPSRPAVSPPAPAPQDEAGHRTEGPSGCADPP